MEVTKTIDFEEITTNEVFYFLYRNETEGAIDAGAENNFFIVIDSEAACEGNGAYYDTDPDRITKIRDNISGTYMMVSEVYIFFLMIVLMFFAVFLIPIKMREHHIPMILRKADENNFHLIMRARNFCLLQFILLSGSLTHLSNYYVEDICLHTTNKKLFFNVIDANMTDYYQYCLVTLYWFVTFPLISYWIANYFKDVSRYCCIPFVITGFVFLGFAGLISAVSIFNTLLNGNGWLIRGAMLGQIGVYILCEMFNSFYRYKFAKRDLLRTEEEEIDV